MQTGQPFNPYGSFVPNALMRWNGVSPGAKLAYARLAQFAGEDGECFPSQETLASELGVSVVQVKRYVKELVTANLLRVERPQGRDRLAHKNNRYTFIWHPIFDSVP